MAGSRVPRRFRFGPCRTRMARGRAAIDHREYTPGFGPATAGRALARRRRPTGHVLTRGLSSIARPNPREIRRRWDVGRPVEPTLRPLALPAPATAPLS